MGARAARGLRAGAAQAEGRRHQRDRQRRAHRRHAAGHSTASRLAASDRSSSGPDTLLTIVPSLETK